MARDSPAAGVPRANPTRGEACAALSEGRLGDVMAALRKHDGNDEALRCAAQGLSKTDAARQLGVAPTKFISMMRRHLPDLEWHDGRRDGRGGRKKRRARR